MTDEDWENTGAPRRYWSVRLDECPDGPADKMRQFCAGNGTDVMVITGGNGTAKTKTVSASFQERADNGLEPGLYLTCAYQLCPMFRSSRLAGFGTSEYELYKRYYDAPYLVIDEYGKGDDIRLVKSVTRNILAARYDRGLLTCLVTNLTMQELVSDDECGLGADMRSRLRETATVVVMDGEDWRETNRGMSHVPVTKREAAGIRCIICGSPMSEIGVCTNPACVANCGIGGNAK